MIAKKRDCAEIAQQILAAREALSKVGIIIMKESIRRIKNQDKKKIEKLMERVFRV